MSVWSATVAYIQDEMTDDDLMEEICCSPDPFLLEETIRDLSLILDDKIMGAVRNLTLRQFRERRREILGGRADEC